MSTFESPLLDKLESLSSETSHLLSFCRNSELVPVSEGRAKQFAMNLSVYVFGSSTAICQQVTHMGKIGSQVLPDLDLLSREISNNILGLNTATQVEIYKKRISNVKDTVWKAKEEISNLREEAESLLPGLEKATEWWADPDSSQAILDRYPNESAEWQKSADITIKMYSCLPLATGLLESLPKNPLIIYWMKLNNILQGFDETDYNAPEVTPTEWIGKKNMFNAMRLEEVVKWFTQLTNRNSSNHKPFLSASQLNDFIERAFLNEEGIDKLTFNMSDGERTAITKLFYEYYKKCTNDYAVEPTQHCKEKYVRLLTDNFTNYKYDTVFDTFNNSKKASMEWDTTI